MIAQACATIVFTEFRHNEAGALLLSHMQASGYRYFALTSDIRGVLIVSRTGFEGTGNPGELDTFPNAIIRADFPGFVLYGVYLPTGARKFPHFDYLIRMARQHNARNELAMAIGDFNAGRNEIDIEINARSGNLLDEFPAHSRFVDLSALWPEAWRHSHPAEREYSWYASNKPVSQKKGWRLDHAFVSPALLPSVRSARYVPESRLQGWTDHSALVVELEAMASFPSG